MSMTFINPKTFNDSDLPLIVLSDDLRSFVGWGIKAHTSGNYNHSFLMNKPGYCVSQDFGGFNEKPIDVYLTSGQMLKFWKIKNLNDNEKFLILLAIHKRLALPWWKKRYDFFGTFVGQFLNIRWIQSPWAWYCSEQVRDDALKLLQRLSKIEWGEPNPSDLDNIFKKYPEYFECSGYWWSE